MKQIHVSDHALMRYLERVEGLNVEAIRNVIRAVCTDAAKVGLNKTMCDGFIYALKYNNGIPAVSTIYPDDGNEPIKPPRGHSKPRNDWNLPRLEVGKIRARKAKGGRRP